MIQFTFLHSNEIDYFKWFMQTIGNIYNIEGLPDHTEALNNYNTDHHIIHAFCGAEFNNWNDDPMLNDSCKGQVFSFKHVSKNFFVKLRVNSGYSALGNLDSGIFKIDEKDPDYESWIKALETIIPNLKLENKSLNNCTDGCLILDKYWAD